MEPGPVVKDKDTGEFILKVLPWGLVYFTTVFGYSAYFSM